MTDQGLNRYDADQESFKSFFYGDGSGLSHNSVTVMTELNGRYYLGTYGGGIDVMEGDRFVKNYNANHRIPIASNLISDMIPQQDNVLWVGTYDQGLSRIDLFTE